MRSITCVMTLILGCLLAVDFDRPTSWKSPVACDVQLIDGQLEAFDIDNRDSVKVPTFVNDELRDGDKLTIWRGASGELDSITLYRNGKSEKSWNKFDE